MAENINDNNNSEFRIRSLELAVAKLENDVHWMKNNLVLARDQAALKIATIISILTAIGAVVLALRK